MPIREKRVDKDSMVSLTLYIKLWKVKIGNSFDYYFFFVSSV